MEDVDGASAFGGHVPPSEEASEERVPLRAVQAALMTSNAGLLPFSCTGAWKCGHNARGVVANSPLRKETEGGKGDKIRRPNKAVRAEGRTEGRIESAWKDVRGRPLHGLRPLMFALDIASEAQGSALCRSGEVQVAVDVVGPLPLTGLSKREGWVCSRGRQDVEMHVKVTRIGGGLESNGLFAGKAAWVAESTIESVLNQSRKAVNDAADKQIAEEQKRQRLACILLEVMKAVVDRSSCPAAATAGTCPAALLVSCALVSTATRTEPFDDDAVAACAINALSLALQRATVRTKGVFGATSGAIVHFPDEAEPVVALDLDAADKQFIRHHNGHLTTCLYAAFSGNVLYLHITGTGWKEPHSQKLLRLVDTATQTISHQLQSSALNR